MLFTFPSRYLFTIGRQVVFSLGRWSSQIQTGFLVSRPTQVPSTPLSILDTGLSPSMADLSRSFSYLIMDRVMTVLQPRTSEDTRFGLLPVRSPLLRESLLFSLPQVTKMFQFTWLASYTYVFSA